MDTDSGEPGTGSGVGGVGSTGSGIGGGSGNDTDGGEPGTGSGISGVGTTGSGIGGKRGEDTGASPGFGLDVDLGMFGELDRSVSLSEVSDLAESFGFGIESEVLGAISGRTAFDKTLGLMMGNPYAQARDTFIMLVTIVSLVAPPTISLALDLAKRAIAQIQVEPTVSVEEYAEIMFELWSRAEDPTEPGDSDGYSNYRFVRDLVDSMLQTETDGAITFADVLNILDPVDTGVVTKPIYRRRSNIVGTGRIGLTIE